MTNKAVGTIELRTKGSAELKNITRQLNSVRRSSRGIARTLGGLRNVFFATFGAAGVREVVNAADSIQLLGDRINAFVGGTEEGAKALDTLFDAANLTNSSVDTLAEGFNRVALATSELGLSTNELIGFTTTLQNAFRIQGASAAEARGATIQLTQGLSSGQLRGQELRSVLEASAVAGQVLADSVGITRGQLIKFAESGGFTSEVVLKAFSERAVQLNKDAQKLRTTFGQALTKAFNEAKRGINDLNNDFKISEKFAASVEFLVDNFKVLASILAGFAGLGFAAALPKIITSLKVAGAAVLGFLTVTKALIIAGVAGLTFLALNWDKFANRVERISRVLSIKIQEFFKSINESVFNFFKSLPPAFAAFGKNSEEALKKNNESIMKNKMAIAELDKEYAKFVKNGKGALKTIKDFANGIFNTSKVAGNVVLTIKQLNNALNSNVISLKEYNRQVRRVEEAQLEKRFKEGQITADEYARELVKINDVNGAFSEKIFTSITFAAAQYTRTIGNLTSQLTTAFESSFQKLEDVIFDSLKNGKLIFSDFTQFVLDELLRVAIRSQVISPFAGAFAGSIGSAQGVIQEAQASVAGFASGGVFQKGRQVQFASGGIVGSPTFFPMSSGTGMMGESGPEAIVPLTRTSGGDLGIKANPSNVFVNVNNDMGAEVDVQSNQVGDDTFLDITITRAVQTAINNGQLDRTMRSNFGLNRKGSR